MGRIFFTLCCLFVITQAVTAQVPSTAVQPGQPLVTFDWRQAELRHGETRWQVRAGNVVLKEFEHEDDGLKALRLIQELELTQHGAIGTPQPVLEYWLTDGHAPTRMPNERRVIFFDPDSLRVEPLRGQWFLHDAKQMLFNFGPHQGDAQEAMVMIRHYGFDQIGFVGRGAPPMMYFLADPRRLASRQRPAGYFGIHAGYDKALKPDPEPGAKPPARDEKALSSTLPVTRQLTSSAILLPDSPVASERVPFDWRQVQAKQDHGEWKLAIGSYTIANFGRNDRLARQAERVVQYYRFTEHCRIGQPTPSFTFFLVSGQPPRGVLFGLNDLPFRPEALRVQQVAGFWAVCDGDRPILQFGDKADDARAAVQVIQRFHFDHLCRVGDAENGMSFLVRSR